MKNVVQTSEVPRGKTTSQLNTDLRLLLLLGCFGQRLQYLFLRSYFLQHSDLIFFLFDLPQLPEQSALHCWAAISTSGIEELNTLSM